MRSVLSTALVATFIATVVTAEPQRYRVVDIGSLVGLSTFPTALNESGDVVGYSQMGVAAPHSEPPTNAFLYSNGVIMDLFGGETGAVSVATAINELGQIVGHRRWAPLSPGQPFLYSMGTGVMFLNPFGLDPLLATGSATGINASGEVVGSAASRAFLMPSPYTSGIGIDLIPGMSAPYYASAASAVNDAGQVVGTLTKPGTFPLFDTSDSFLIQDGVGIIPLDEILNAQYPDASFFPLAINNAGVVVGYAHGPTLSVHAVSYDNGFFMNLGDLGGNSYGYGVDSEGRVVGRATLADGSWRAFLWEEGVMYDLNDYLPSGAGVVLHEARAINDNGQIVAWGADASDPWPPAIVHTFLLTPGDASGEIEDLIDFIEGLGLHQGIENSLTRKLENALAAVASGDVEQACDLLGAFINEVEAQTGKKISDADAATLLEEAAGIRGLLGCG